MDDSLLNLAHRAGQRALVATVQGDYVSGIQFHLQAAQYLKTLQDKLPESNSLKGSLNYFVQDHERQARLVQFLRNRTEVQNRKDGQGAAMIVNENVPPPTPGRKVEGAAGAGAAGTIGESMMDQFDSLLPIHLRPALGPNNYNHLAPGAGTLRPRNYDEQIEELELTINQLREIVEAQSTQIEELQSQLAASQAEEQGYLQEIEELNRQLDIAKQEYEQRHQTHNQ